MSALLSRKLPWSDHQLLSVKGAANPQVPGRKPPGAMGALAMSPGLQAHCHHSNFLAGLDLSACGPRKENPCTPGDNFSCSKSSSSGPAALAQRSREGSVHFLSPFDVGKEILCRMKTIPLPPMGIHHHVVMHGSHAATSPLPPPTARVSQRDSYLFSGGC